MEIELPKCKNKCDATKYIFFDISYLFFIRICFKKISTFHLDIHCWECRKLKISLYEQFKKSFLHLHIFFEKIPLTQNEIFRFDVMRINTRIKHFNKHLIINLNRMHKFSVAFIFRMVLIIKNVNTLNETIFHVSYMHLNFLVDLFVLRHYFVLFNEKKTENIFCSFQTACFSSNSCPNVMKIIYRFLFHTDESFKNSLNKYL